MKVYVYIYIYIYISPVDWANTSLHLCRWIRHTHTHTSVLDMTLNTVSISYSIQKNSSPHWIKYKLYTHI